MHFASSWGCGRWHFASWKLDCWHVKQYQQWTNGKKDFDIVPVCDNIMFWVKSKSFHCSHSHFQVSNFGPPTCRANRGPLCLEKWDDELLIILYTTIKINHLCETVEFPANLFAKQCRLEKHKPTSVAFWKSAFYLDFTKVLFPAVSTSLIYMWWISLTLSELVLYLTATTQ